MHDFWNMQWQKEREKERSCGIQGSLGGATAACSVFGSRSVLCDNEMRMSGVVCVWWHGFYQLQTIFIVWQTQSVIIKESDSSDLEVCRDPFFITQSTNDDEFVVCWHDDRHMTTHIGERHMLQHTFIEWDPMLYKASCLLFNYIRTPNGVATNRSFAFWDDHVTMNVMFWMHCHELGGQRPWSEDHVYSNLLAFTTWYHGTVNGLVIDDNHLQRGSKMRHWLLNYACE